VVALISDLFIVGPDPQVWKKGAVMSTSMVCGMVI
jgi:hypothetical protein